MYRYFVYITNILWAIVKKLMMALYTNVNLEASNQLLMQLTIMLQGPFIFNNKYSYFRMDFYCVPKLLIPPIQVMPKPETTQLYLFIYIKHHYMGIGA